MSAKDKRKKDEEQKKAEEKLKKNQKKEEMKDEDEDEDEREDEEKNLNELDEEDDEFDDVDDDFEDEEDVESYKKKNQNITALAILFAGLFVGSLFVDIVQWVKGEGISRSKLKEIEDNGVFQSSQNKTWVLNNEPIVKATLLTDTDCEECQNETIVLNFKKASVPTALFETIDYKSDKGKELTEKLDIKVVPVVIFEEELKETNFYEQNQPFIQEKEGSYYIENSLISAAFRIGGKKYVQSPEFSSKTAILGEEVASVPVIIYGDFQCPYSKQFAVNFAQVYEENKEDLKVAFKQLPLTSIHPQAYGAAHASMCANDQGQFWEMYTKLYDTQSVWGAKGATNAEFSNLAVELGLNKAEFDQCMTDDIHREEIEADRQAAAELSISGTPAAFIGEEFIGGAVAPTKIKEIIEKAKE
ncbi:MAG: thioredoxin domain-containing protein [Candidatus Moranbacteria bacterium]|nr:thioredoxin domain-containing protein [Candidatus Moranbacteria bacterium]